MKWPTLTIVVFAIGLIGCGPDADEDGAGGIPYGCFITADAPCWETGDLALLTIRDGTTQVVTRKDNYFATDGTGVSDRYFECGSGTSPLGTLIIDGESTAVEEACLTLDSMPANDIVWRTGGAVLQVPAFDPLDPVIVDSGETLEVDFNRDGTAITAYLTEVEPGPDGIQMSKLLPRESGRSGPHELEFRESLEDSFDAPVRIDAWQGSAQMIERPDGTVVGLVASQRESFEL